MNRESQFYQFIQQNRVRLSDLRSDTDYARAVIYINSAIEAANQFEVAELMISKVEADAIELSQAKKNFVANQLFVLEQYVTELQSRNIFFLDGNLRRDFVSLDENWRARATTYLSHIRDSINAAQVEKLHRESILSKLNTLQAEIDRSRARIHSFSEVFLELTSSISEGAKKLEPAVKLIERISGAVYGLQRRELQAPERSLPSPDRLGLPEPGESKEATKDNHS